MKRIFGLALTLFLVAALSLLMRSSQCASSTPTLLTPAPSPTDKGRSGTGASAVGWRVEPGIVKECEGKICGTFKLRKDPKGSASKRGGGCLILQPMEPKDVTLCKVTTDCQGKNLGFPYCVPDASTPPSSPSASGIPNQGLPVPVKTCWYRPPPDNCIRSGANDLDENREYTVQAAKALPLNVRWRVITCQSITQTGCAGGKEGIDKIYRYSMPWEEK